MITLNIILSACLAIVTPETEDSIRTERVEEVIVTANSTRQRIQNVQMGEEVIRIEELTNTPRLFGEKDIMRSIQLLPGVKMESDASSSFQVRGGTSA
jgi:outer membrane receptor for ferrienterochelin and colicin